MRECSNNVWNALKFNSNDSRDVAMNVEDFSLIVVTKDRLDFVRRLFCSFELQTYKKFSVIFVYENTCKNAAKGLIEEFRDKFPIVPVESELCGVSRARNLALPLANGTYVAFPDDDCWYTPDTLAQVAAVFARQPGVDGILAQRVGDIAEPAPAGARQMPVNRYTAFRGSEAFLQFYRARCVHNVGPYDETLGAGSGLPYGSGEDTDYVLRALACGARVARIPSVRVAHPEPDLTDPALPRKTAAYAAGRMWLLRKHGFPFWFRLVNVLYPLAALPKDMLRKGRRMLPYRWHMFRSRLAGF